ncbi:MAG: extracellular solute-binding protein [Chloroflexi bacterium]|nr:MAG: extracellular solute-binding protein [Chloroflexota bacterium]MBL1192781.1 extracellular solute-binding protein [Chloroflexota bacterium]NOH10075.1 extracellular solute-binding protein [Chloroflexota bacterium]
MKKNIWIYAIALVVVMSMVLAACGGGAATEAPSAEEPAGEEPAAEEPAGEEPSGEEAMEEKEPVVLTFIKIADELEAQAFDEMVAAFQQIEDGKWSHVSIEYDAKPFAELFPAIETSVATGAKVDLIQADGPDVKHFAWNGVIQDLSDYFTEEELQQWFPQSVEDATYEGGFYGPPEVQSCQMLWYRTDYVEAAGIEIDPDVSLTYGPDGTGLPVWQKLTVDEDGDGNPEVFGFQNNGPFWFDYLNRIPARTNGVPGSPTYEGVSEDGLTHTGYFDTDEAIEAYQFDQDLFYEYGVRSIEPPPNAMLAGFSAMFINQDLVVGIQRDQFPDVEIDAAAPPYWQTPMCQTGSWHYGISTTTEHFEETLAFVKYASSDEGAAFIWKYKNQFPANINFLATVEEYQTYPRSLMAEFFVEFGKSRIVSPGYTEYNALFGQFYQALVSGGDVEELTREYAQLMDEAMAKYK